MLNLSRYENGDISASELFVELKRLQEENIRLYKTIENMMPDVVMAALRRGDFQMDLAEIGKVEAESEEV